MGSVKVNDRVVASVDGHPILDSELENEKQNVIQMLKVEKREDEIQKGPAFDKKVLMQMIEDRLLDREISKRGLEASDTQVEQVLKNIMQENRIQSKEDFKRLLQAEGVSFEEFETNYRKRISRNNFVRQAIQPKINIRPEEIEQELQRLAKQENNTELQYDFRMIRIDQSRLTKKEITKLHKEVVQNQSFKETAKVYEMPNDGLIKNMGQSDLQKPIQQALEDLEKLEISPVLELDDFWVLIQKVDQRVLDLSVSDQMRAQVADQLFNERVTKSLNQTLSDLKQKALINIYL